MKTLVLIKNLMSYYIISCLTSLPELTDLTLPDFRETRSGANLRLQYNSHVVAEMKSRYSTVLHYFIDFLQKNC